MSKPKVKIKKILDKDGNVIRTEVDIDNSALVKTVRGKTGAEGMIGPVGATGLQGEPGEPGKDIDQTVVKELKESISSAEEEIQSTKKTLSKLDKKNDKRITGVANINKSIRSDITTLDSNLIGHIDNKDVHFNDKIQKDKVIDHLEQDHTTQIITGGGSPPHNFLQGLDGGNDRQGTNGEFFHLNEEDYNTATNILQTPDSLIDVGHIDFDISHQSSNPSEGSVEGRVEWNAIDHTLDIDTGQGTVTQAGQEVIFQVYNNTAETIPDGKVVYLSGGSTDSFPNIKLAQANSHDNLKGEILVSTNTIPAGELGFANMLGKVRGFDTSHLQIGEFFVSASEAGELVNTPPGFPNFNIALGNVIKISATDGEIQVVPSGDIFATFPNFWNGIIRETMAFKITVPDSLVTGTLEPFDGHPDLTLVFSSGMHTFNVFTNPSEGNNIITLQHGTDSVPVLNYVFIKESDKLLTSNITGFPYEVEHIKIATVYLQSIATVEAIGALILHQHNDHIQNTTSHQGHFTHVTDRLRIFPAQWAEGTEGIMTAPAAAGGAVPNADVFLTMTEGVVYQIHRHSVPVQVMPTKHIHVVNHPTTPFLQVSNLNGQTQSAEFASGDGGVSLANSSFSFVLWAVVNSGTEKDHLMINLPTGKYLKNNPDSAVEDANNFSDYSIPSEFNGVGFLIARFTMVLEANGTTWTQYSKEDLRGRVPNVSAGGGSAGGGATSLLGLTDTPATYAGEALNILQVDATESFMEFTGDPTFDSITTTGNAVLSNVITDGDISIQGLLSVGSGDDALAGFNLARFDETMTSGTSFGLTVDVDGDPATVNSITSLLARTGVNGTGSINDATGFVVFSPEITSGTIVNLYGIQIQDQTVGTSGNWAIKTNAGILDFGDDVWIASDKRIYFGDSQESSIFFDGNDLNITRNDPSQAGVIKLTDDVEVSGTLTVGEYTLPATDGTNGQVLQTNGSGVLTWVTL